MAGLSFSASELARARGNVCRPCNADACNDTIPLGINRLPLLSKEEKGWGEGARIEGKGGKERKEES